MLVKFGLLFGFAVLGLGSAGAWLVVAPAGAQRWLANSFLGAHNPEPSHRRVKNTIARLAGLALIGYAGYIAGHALHLEGELAGLF
jgi:hypothetical protein